MSGVKKKKTRVLKTDSLVHEYRILEVLGIGSFGITYKAIDTHLSIPVALKEFLPHQHAYRNDKGQIAAKNLDKEPVYQWGLARFIGEAQVLAQFKHQNIVRVSRYFPANGTAYIVMDYEEGITLYERLAKGNEEVDEKFLKQTFIPILEGLQELHSKRYLHRDIKPGNIYLRSHGSPMLIDFGAARIDLGEDGSDTTNVLTPGYAPPEQYTQTDQQGPATDLYALGATIYRCISGSTPIDAQQRVEAMKSNDIDLMRPAVEIGQGKFSKAFLETIDAMLQLDYLQRPAHVNEVLGMIPGSQQPEIASAVFVSTHHARKKFVIAGTSGSGKSTLLKTLADEDPITTERPCHNDENQLTTVALDYAMHLYQQDIQIHLYAAPGKPAFDFMHRILLTGADGMLLLIDARTENPALELERLLAHFRDTIDEQHFVVGITHTSAENPLQPADLYPLLSQHSGKLSCLPAIFELDPGSKEDAAILLDALMCSIDPGIDDYDI